jgi:non-canonical (house-cleaning) NTP pyrophosphatase
MAPGSKNQRKRQAAAAAAEESARLRKTTRTAAVDDESAVDDDSTESEEHDNEKGRAGSNARRESDSESEGQEEGEVFEELTPTDDFDRFTGTVHSLTNASVCRQIIQNYEMFMEGFYRDMFFGTADAAVWKQLILQSEVFSGLELRPSEGSL